MKDHRKDDRDRSYSAGRRHPVEHRRSIPDPESGRWAHQPRDVVVTIPRYIQQKRPHGSCVGKERHHRRELPAEGRPGVSRLHGRSPRQPRLRGPGRVQDRSSLSFLSDGARQEGRSRFRARQQGMELPLGLLGQGYSGRGGKFDFGMAMIMRTDIIKRRASLIRDVLVHKNVDEYAREMGLRGGLQRARLNCSGLPSFVFSFFFSVDIASSGFSKAICV